MLKVKKKYSTSIQIDDIFQNRNRNRKKIVLISHQLDRREGRLHTLE